MREFKFRAWDNEIKKMSTTFNIFEYASDQDGEYGSFEYPDGDAVEKKGDMIMQYTGLEDKNGKAIYEGDIVKYNDMIVPVTFKDGAFCTDNVSQTRIDEDWEVIGNIYENPELLKV